MTCPDCGSKSAIILISSIKCDNPKCQFFDKSLTKSKPLKKLGLPSYFKNFKYRGTKIGRFSSKTPNLSNLPRAYGSKWGYGSIKNIYKNQFRKGIIDFHGPVAGQVGVKTTSNNKFLFKIGKKYTLDIPLSEKHRFWYKQWHSQTVKVVGFYNYFQKGHQSVCVFKKGLGNLAASSAWLKPLQIKSCSCSTDVIWSKGCQCGGN